MADREVSVGFIAKTGSFTRDLNAMGQTVLALKSRIDSLVASAAAPLAKMGAAISGIGISGASSMALFTKNAISFETEMRNVNSILRESSEGYNALKQEILSLAQTVPKTAEDLAGAAYDIVSSGFSSASDMNLILAASAKAATAGLTETKTAAGAISTVLNAYNMNADQASYVSDVLFKTVDKGRVTFDQLALQMGDFISLSKSSGATLEESMAMYAKLTVLTGQYAQSATSITGIMRAFIKPSADMKSSLERLTGQGHDMNMATAGTMTVLNKLYDSVGRTKEGMGKLIPDTEGLRGALSLLGVPADELSEFMSEFTDRSKLAGSTQRVFAEQMKAVGNQLTAARTALNAVGIQLAQGFLPFLSQAVDVAKFFLDAFSDLPQPVKTLAGVLVGLSGVIAAVGGAMVAWRAKKILTALALKKLGFEATTLTGVVFPNMAKGMGDVSKFTNIASISTKALGSRIFASGEIMRSATTIAAALAGALRGVGVASGFTGNMVANTGLMMQKLGMTVYVIGQALVDAAAKAGPLAGALKAVGNAVMDAGNKITLAGNETQIAGTKFAGTAATMSAAATNMQATLTGAMNGAAAATEAAGTRIAVAGGHLGRLTGMATKAQGALTKLGGAAGIASKAFMGFLILPMINDALDSVAGVGSHTGETMSKLGSDLLKFGKDGQIAGDMAKILGTDLGELHDAAKSLDQAIYRQVDPILPDWFRGSEGSKQAKKDIDALDNALASMASSGAGEQAAAILEQLRTKYEAMGWDFDLVETHLNDYQDAAAGSTFSNDILAQSLAGVEDATAGVTEQTKAMTKAQQAVQTGFGWFSASDALSRASERVSAVKQETEDSGKAAKQAAKEYDEWLKGAEERTDAVTRSQWRLRDANEKVAEIRKEIKKVDEEWATNHAQNVTSAENSLTRARWASADATKKVKDIEQALKEMREPPARTIREAEIALARAHNQQAEAMKAVTYQQAKLEFARLQGTPEEIAQAERELAEAEWKAEEAAWAVEDATGVLNDIRNPTATEAYKNMEHDLEVAHLDEKEAIVGVDTAQRNLDAVRAETKADALKGMERDLESALLDVKEATREVNEKTGELTYKTDNEASPAVKNFDNKLKDAKTSLVDFKNELTTQQTDMQNWLTNLETIAQKGPPGLAAKLAEMGAEGTRIVGELATKTPAEMQGMFDKLMTQEITKTDAWATYLEEGFRNGKGRATTMNTEMITAIATDLGIMYEDAKRLLSDYLKVSTPALEPTKSLWDSIKGAVESANGPIKPGSMWDSMLNSGLLGMPALKGVPAPAPAPAPAPPKGKAAGGITRSPMISSTPILWAEAGPEAYIPLGMDRRYQSTQLLSEVADIFGYRLLAMADGGMYRMPATGGGGHGRIEVNMPIHVEARVAAGIDMDYASRVIAEKVQAGVRTALDRLAREMVVKSWRN